MIVEGEYKIDGLSRDEYDSAMQSIKLIRSEAIKNAYLEGYADGIKEEIKRRRGENWHIDPYGWEGSHAKKLLDKPTS